MVATALRLANSGASDCCCVAAVSDATDTAIRSSGVRGSLAAGAAACAGFAIVLMVAGVFAGAFVAASDCRRDTGRVRRRRTAPCPTIASRTVPSGVCDTASCKFCPGVSATSDITSIESPAIAICTRFSATLSTCASTTVPGCNTTPDVALPVACAAMTGRLGLTVSAMAATLARGDVNLSLT